MLIYSLKTCLYGEGGSIRVLKEYEGVMLRLFSRDILEVEIEVYKVCYTSHKKGGSRRVMIMSEVFK